MKKHIVIATFIAAACFLSNKSIGQDLQLEIIGGPALTSFYGAKGYRSIYKQMINITTGVGLAYSLNEKSYINAKLLYERKGGKNESDMRDAYNNNIGEVTFRAAYDYITLPVQYRREIGNKVRFQFGAGIYGAYLVEQSYIQRADGNPQFDYTEVHTDYYKRFDFGISVSANTYIPVNESLKIIIGVNNNLGLLGTNKIELADDGSIKHNSLALTAGVSVKL